MMTSFFAALWLMSADPTAESIAQMSRVDAARMIAGCVMKRDRISAIKLAAAVPSTAQIDKAVRQIEPSLTACLKSELTSLTLRVIDLRGALAEALLNEANGSALARARTLPSIPAQRITLGKSEAVNDAILFRCVVGANPTDAVALVQAPAGSVDEGAAFRALMPALQACVSEKAEMHLKQFQIRLLVAAALYGRLAEQIGA